MHNLRLRDLLLTVLLYTLASIGSCFDISYEGPKVKIQTPWRGSRLKSVVLVSLHIDIGTGEDSIQIQNQPQEYKVCFTGGKELSCIPLVGGSGVGNINVSSYNGVSEVSAWIQSIFTPESIDSAFGQGDIVVAYDSAILAVPILQDRVNGLKGWKATNKSYFQALRYFDLGHALMRSQPVQGTHLSHHLVAAAASLGASVALGCKLSIGALDEVMWLSGNMLAPFPLFPCGYNGDIQVPLIPGGPRSMASFAIYLSSSGEWAFARENIVTSLTEACHGHESFSLCVSEGVKSSMYALIDQCGDLRDLNSVVKAHAFNPSDINEHILTLKSLAAEVDSVLELGVRGCSSSWAFLQGLTQGKSQNPRLIQNDIDDCFSVQFDVVARRAGVHVQYHWQDDLTLHLPHPVDLVFIDTYHVYGQLKRELAKFSQYAQKYMVLHDTTVDGEHGELVRLGHNLTQALSDHIGWKEEDMVAGLWRAVEEFLKDNDEWVLQDRYTNNNGLTVLRRIVPLDFVQTENNMDVEVSTISGEYKENSRGSGIWHGLF